MSQYSYQGEGVLKVATPVIVDETEIYTARLNTISDNGKNLVNNYLDNIARQKGYDNIISARSYAGYENDFQLESQKFVKLSASCWSLAYSIIDDLKNGTLESITDEEFISRLPTFETV